MNLYLDIDGVLLGKEEYHLKLANGVNNFIKLSLEHFDCYWLTTHCKGDSSSALNYIKAYCDKDTLLLLEKIKPTNFNVLKTDAIDFEKEFIWIDDFLLQSEIEVLDQHQKLSSWYQLNTYKNLDELYEFTQKYFNIRSADSLQHDESSKKNY